MRLCRFELREDPGTVRSGVLHQDHLYETEGLQPVGRHDLGEIRLLAPLGALAGLRACDLTRDDQGTERLNYHFLNHNRIVGPATEIVTPAFTRSLDFEARVCVALKDGGEAIDAGEAPTFVLGYSLMTILIATDLMEEEAAANLPPGRSKDLGIAFGPFLITPEGLGDYVMAGEPTRFRLPYRIRVAGNVIAEGVHEMQVSFGQIVEVSSEFGSVLSGEVFGAPPFEKESLSVGPLGRGLLPGDRVSVEVAGLGPLVTVVA